jgi:hypothetical protein
MENKGPGPQGKHSLHLLMLALTEVQIFVALPELYARHWSLLYVADRIRDPVPF